MLIERGSDKFVIAGDPVVKGSSDDEEAMHKVNLMLECFKRVELMQDSMKTFQVPQRIIALNWKVLPQGSMPWERFQEHLRPVLQNVSERGHKVIYDRFGTIANYYPDSWAYGTNGYKGYVILGFTLLNLYICESALYGNATYVFEGEWEHISKLTKAEIIHANLHKHRFVHQEGWKKQIAGLLSPHLAAQFKKTTNPKNKQNKAFKLLSRGPPCSFIVRLYVVATLGLA
jgi:hypothetical protein